MDDPYRALFEALNDLHLNAGEPSSRDIARLVNDRSRGGEATISHTTASLVLRGPRLPKFPHLEAVVQALGGNVEAFRPLWTAARKAERSEGTRQRWPVIEAEAEAARILGEARAEADRIVGDAREQAEAETGRILNKARADAYTITEHAREQAEAETGRILNKARAEAVTVAEDAKRKGDDQAIRVLMMAQRTADDHIADGRREAERLKAEAEAVLAAARDEANRTMRARIPATIRRRGEPPTTPQAAYTGPQQDSRRSLDWLDD